MIFITTKNGKRDGKIALKNNFAPEIVYWIQIFGANIIWKIIREQINVTDKFIFKVLNNLNSKNNIENNNITNNNFNFKPLLKVLLY